MTTEVTAPAGPLAPAARSLGPDLARGVMLLAIALANSHYFVEGSSYFGGFPQDGGPLDRAVAWTLATFVDGRAFPMFGLLFGYGVAQVVRRQGGAPPKRVRRLLWRRATFLVVVGFLHATLLFAGDILAAYGVLLFLGAWAVRWRDGWLLAGAALFLVLTSMPGEGSFAAATYGPDPTTMLPTDLGAMLVDRAFTSAFVASLGPIGFGCPFLLGLWAGRRRLLEPPPADRRAARERGLLVTGVVGLAVAVAGAQPIALVQLGVLDVPANGDVLGPLHDTAGVAGGVAYAALLALLALRLQDRRSRLVDAVAAVGQRSMTCYLAQSVMWTLAFTPALLGLSDVLSVTGCAVLATATWLLTVALADWMHRTGRRGPFEVLLRRATYG
ncbi:Uncharacterized membrane protein YeiB [Nocardioides exalbidus]|uniref:Uncharacterized membrane protein YeiB n=1 Tax=Nocardioides exalbidus TaxID=402596 RepID=A0A1H4QAX2_9ACTN|nr:DUF418 domain-containing protein [Nocardioides exalbidus]SEC16783.1 Uncharacterized membrane protein YeiB [Nocardioides exalbidus]